MSRKRATVDEEEEDVADGEENPSVDATPAPKRQRVAKMRAAAKLASHTDDMTVDDTRASRSEAGDQQQQLGDAAQKTASRRPRRQTTPPSRMDTLLSQVPVEVWERVVPRLDVGGALALFSINTHMVDMGDLYQVDNQPLRSTLVSTLGEIGGVVVKFGHKRQRVPRLHRLYWNRALFELFGENSVPERMHVEDLPSVCGRSLSVLHCVLRRTKLSKSTHKALSEAVSACVPFPEAGYSVLLASDAPRSLLQSFRVYSSMEAIYDGKAVWSNQVYGTLGDADSMGRTLADVPLPIIVTNVKKAILEPGWRMRHTASALTQVFVGHGLAGVKEAMAAGMSGCDGMLACIADMLPEREWPKALQAICESKKNLTLLQELAKVLDNRALVSCVLSTLPMNAVFKNVHFRVLHKALILVQGEEKAMGTLVKHANLLYKAARRDKATEEWIANTPEIVAKLDKDAVARLYREYQLQTLLAALVQRKAWEKVIDVAEPRDLRVHLESKGMVLPQEHVARFLKRALDKTGKRNNSVLWAVKQHTAHLGLETVLECYKGDHDERLLPILFSKEKFDDDDSALWVPCELNRYAHAEAIWDRLQERWQQQVNRCVSVCRENGAAAFVDYVRQWTSRTVRKDPCNDSEVMTVAMEGLENEDVVEVGKLVNAEELETGRWSKELATEERWMQLLDDGFPVKVLGIMMPGIDGFRFYSEELQRRIVRGLMDQGMMPELKRLVGTSRKAVMETCAYLYELDSSSALEKLHEIHDEVDRRMLVNLVQLHKDPRALEELVSRSPYMLVTRGMYEAVRGELGERTQKRWEKVERVRQECHAQRGDLSELAREVLSSDSFYSDDALIRLQVLLECGYRFGEKDWSRYVRKGGAKFLASLGIVVSDRPYCKTAHRGGWGSELESLRGVYSAFSM